LLIKCFKYQKLHIYFCFSVFNLHILISKTDHLLSYYLFLEFYEFFIDWGQIVFYFCNLFLIFVVISGMLLFFSLEFFCIDMCIAIIQECCFCNPISRYGRISLIGTHFFLVILFYILLFDFFLFKLKFFIIFPNIQHVPT
jgi:hypothetical protein